MKTTASLFLWTFALLVSSAHCETILIDDFNDGSDDGWIHFDMSAGQPGGPGLFDASSGAYNLRTSGVVPAGLFTPLQSLWESSSDALYSDGLLRATVRAGNGGSAAVLQMRWEQSGPPSGYNFFLLDPDEPTADFAVEAIVGGEVVRGEHFEVPGFPTNAGEKWTMEAGTVGDQITLKVWPIGQPEPTMPQLTWTDTNISSGQFGVVAVRPFPVEQPWQINSTFDDIYFTAIPEPSTWTLGLLGVGLMMIATVRRRCPSSRTSSAIGAMAGQMSTS